MENSQRSGYQCLGKFNNSGQCVSATSCPKIQYTEIKTLEDLRKINWSDRISSGITYL